VAAKGGLIGIGSWDRATCGTDARAIAKAVWYVSDRVGAEHVALGSDLDGAITAPFDTTGLVEVTDAMLEAGYSEQELRMIMGEKRNSLFAAEPSLKTRERDLNPGPLGTPPRRPIRRLRFP
jgi:microsomal dipeptidase-like Zn-dependent dipeptidase